MQLSHAFTVGVELLGPRVLTAREKLLSRCRWGHGWCLLIYVNVLCMYALWWCFVLILMVESSHLQYQHTNGSQRMDFWGEILKEAKWPEKWFDTYLGDGGNIWEYICWDSQKSDLEKTIHKALQAHHCLVRPYTAADFRRQDESDDEGFYNALLVLQYGQESQRLWWRRSHGHGDSRHFAFDCFCRVGLCLNFSSNMNMPETEAPFCDPHWCRCHQFHPQFLCCAVCRGQWHSTEWWHA